MEFFYPCSKLKTLFRNSNLGRSYQIGRFVVSDGSATEEDSNGNGKRNWATMAVRPNDGRVIGMMTMAVDGWDVAQAQAGLWLWLGPFSPDPPLSRVVVTTLFCKNG